MTKRPSNHLLRTIFLLLLPPCLAVVGCGEKHTPVSRIAFGSCAHQNRDQSFWQKILDVQPDLFIFAGDTIYGDTTNMVVLAKKYKKLEAKPGFQKLRETCPVLAVWDDHDYGRNDVGKEYPYKRESKNLFLDCFREPAHSPRRKREGIYTAKILGPAGRRVQVILLDTRSFRDKLKKPDGSRGGGSYVPQLDRSTTILGTRQWQWFKAQLQRPAEIRLVVSSIQILSEEHSWEKWMNFPHERVRLFEMLEASGQPGILLLSGDRHRGEVSKFDGALKYPLYEITSSGLNMSWENGPPESNRHRISDLYGQSNFGLISIDWAQADPTVTLEIHATSGGVLTTETIPLSRLSPKA